MYLRKGVFQMNGCGQISRQNMSVFLPFEKLAKRGGYLFYLSFSRRHILSPLVRNNGRKLAQKCQEEIYFIYILFRYIFFGLK